MSKTLLWFDSRLEFTLEAKMERAIRHFKKKHEVRPTQIYLHPLVLAQYGGNEYHGIELIGTNSVLPNHFYLTAKT